MGNHKLEHCQSKINTTSPRVSKAKVAKTWEQLVGIEVTQSFNIIITTIGMHMVVVPNMNVAKRGTIIKFVVNLGC
jgi:hypothetical protein